MRRLRSYKICPDVFQTSKIHDVVHTPLFSLLAKSEQHENRHQRFHTHQPTMEGNLGEPTFSGDSTTDDQH